MSRLASQSDTSLKERTSAVKVGQCWKPFSPQDAEIAIVGFDTANGRVRVRKCGASRDSFLAERTIRRRFRLAEARS